MPEAIFIPNFIGRLVRTFSAPAEIEAKEVLEDDNLIRINRAIGKVSVIYEKLRNAVDYNDEHLLRKNAIFRLIKRLVVIEKREEKLGLFLIQELIRIKYLPNNSIPESRAQEVEAVLQKYLAIENLARQHYSARATGKLVNWYLQIAACELEDILFDFRQRQALVNAMVRVLKRDVELPENIKPETQNLLFNLTVLRGLLKSDEVVLDYYLLSELTPNFFTARPASETIKQMVFDWLKLRSRMAIYLDHPLKNKLNRVGKKYAVYFLILRDTLMVNPEKAEELVSRPKLLADKVEETCQRRYREIRIKVVRAVVRSIIYILITKMFLAFIIEVPLDMILANQLNYISLAINVLFPPFLMFVVSLFIRLPRKKNTEEIIKGIKEVVYQPAETGEKKYHLHSNVMRRQIKSFFFNLFYLVTYGITFGLVVWFLYAIDFSLPSGIIFIFFLCVVSFFAITIRQKARDLIVLNRQEGFINLLFDFFSLPIVRIGQWLSIKLSKINVFVFILDFIIEAPLKLILETVEDWFSFVKEKKEDIY